MNPPTISIQPGIPYDGSSSSAGCDDPVGVAGAGVAVADGVGTIEGGVSTPPPFGAVADGLGLAVMVGLVDGVGFADGGGLVVPGGGVCSGGGSVGWAPGGAAASVGRVSTHPGKIRSGSLNVVRPDTCGQYLPLFSSQISGHRSGSPRNRSAMRHSDSPLTTLCSEGRPSMRTVTEPTGVSATA